MFDNNSGPVFEKKDDLSSIYSKDENSSLTSIYDKGDNNTLFSFGNDKESPYSNMYSIEKDSSLYDTLSSIDSEKSFFSTEVNKKDNIYGTSSSMGFSNENESNPFENLTKREESGLSYEGAIIGSTSSKEMPMGYTEINKSDSNDYNNKHVNASFNMKANYQGSIGVIERMSGLVAKREELSFGDVSIAEMYMDSSMDTRTMGGAYNFTLSDTYTDRQRFLATQGLLTFGGMIKDIEVPEKENKAESSIKEDETIFSRTKDNSSPISNGLIETERPESSLIYKKEEKKEGDNAKNTSMESLTLEVDSKNNETKVDKSMFSSENKKEENTHLLEGQLKIDSMSQQVDNLKDQASKNSSLIEEFSLADSIDNSSQSIFSNGKSFFDNGDEDEIKNRAVTIKMSDILKKEEEEKQLTKSGSNSTSEEDISSLEDQSIFIKDREKGEVKKKISSSDLMSSKIDEANKRRVASLEAFSMDNNILLTDLNNIEEKESLRKERDLSENKNILMKDIINRKNKNITLNKNEEFDNLRETKEQNKERFKSSSVEEEEKKIKKEREKKVKQKKIYLMLMKKEK